MRVPEQIIAQGTETQKKYLEAINSEGSIRKAGKLFGVNKETVRKALALCQTKAALRGFAPEHDMTKTTPDSHIVKGTSTLYSADGDIKLQWVKTDLDRDARTKLMLEIIQQACETVEPLPAISPPPQSRHELCTLYTLTDAHVGMYASALEGGQDWDLEIAERVLKGCFDYLIDGAPDSEVGIVAQLGDLLHYDSLQAVTPTSKHVLDASGRFSEMAHVAVRVLRHIVTKALSKHPKVVLILAEGNHDLSSSVWLRIMFKALFENNARVEIVDSESPYYAYQHGKVMLGWHHSHLKNMDQLPLYMATEFSKMWGQTSMRYFHTGDKHHSHEKEYSGAIVTQHPTLAARDAYASRHGWHALRSATAVVYHSEHGRVGRNSVNPETMLVS